MKKNFVKILPFLVLLGACEKNEPNTEALLSQIQVRVYNTNTWDAYTNKLPSEAGAKVYLINDTQTLSSTTNADGLTTFTNVKTGNYWIVADKENLSNLVNKSLVNGKEVGYLVTGVYFTEYESTLYKKNKGDAILLDTNGDGKESSDDWVRGKSIKFEEKFVDYNGDGKINQDDERNGVLTHVESILKEEVFLGKK